MRTKTEAPKARARRPMDATSEPWKPRGQQQAPGKRPGAKAPGGVKRGSEPAAMPIPDRDPDTAGRSPARALAVPTLRAERLYGHASPDRMHTRDKMDAFASPGRKTRQAVSQPPSRPKAQRKHARSGARAGAGARMPKGRMAPS